MKSILINSYRNIQIFGVLNRNILVISFLLATLLAPMLYELVSVWKNNQDLSHGFLVIPMSMYMILKKRGLLIDIPSKPSWIGIPVLIIGVTIYVLGSITKFHSITYIFSIFTIVGVMLVSFGLPKTKALALPLLFLLFMFPIPTSYYILITNPLKYYITSISANILGILGIPVYQEGNLLSFVNTKLEVAEACSGIRSIYSYIMLSFMLSIFSKQKKTIVLLIISAIPLSLIVNVIRVSGTGILANFYGEKVAQGFFHEFSGIVLFIIGIIVLYTFYNILERNKIEEI